MAEFKKGTVVVLKSGGPLMTVTNDAPEGAIEVQCVWMDFHKQYNGVFHPESLLDVGTTNIKYLYPPATGGV